MHGRHIPYLVGGFMLLPYGFWLIAWAFFLPGPKAGFNVPMSMAMFAVTVPLVAWFFLANLSFMANSIAGADPFRRPATRWVRWTVAKLPAATLLTGVATLPYLLASGAPLPLALLPLSVALLVSWAIDRGEAARERETRRGERTAAQARPRAVETLAGLGRFVLQAVYRVPVIGWMVRELVHGSDEDRTFFALNLGLIALFLLLGFGFPTLLVFALALVPVAFLAMLFLTVG